MDAADFVTHYYLSGQPVEPPANTEDEDLDIALYEDFSLQPGLVIEMRCTADGALVHASAPGGGQGMACSQGHRWLHVPRDHYQPDGTVLQRVGWTWRQIA